MNRDAWPPLGEELTQGWLSFAEGDGSEVAGEFKPVAKSADAAEEVEDTEGHAALGLIQV